MIPDTPEDSQSTVSDPGPSVVKQIESEFQRQRAEFYLNSIPLAARNGDTDAMETAYDRLNKLAEYQTETGDSGGNPSLDWTSKLYLSRAGKRQVLGKWQAALDALDCVDLSFLQIHKDHAVSYWCLKALIYLGLGQIDGAEEAGIKALEIAREVVGSSGDGGRNTSYFIMAITMAKKGDRMEAAFYKSLVKESTALDREILEKQWGAFDAIHGDFGVNIISKQTTNQSTSAKGSTTPTEGVSVSSSTDKTGKKDDTSSTEQPRRKAGRGTLIDSLRRCFDWRVLAIIILIAICMQDIILFFWVLVMAYVCIAIYRW